MLRISSALIVATLLGAGSGFGQTVTTGPAPLAPQSQQALESAPSGTVVQWKNPDGATSTVVPQPAFQSASGQICREFQQTVTIAGKPQQAYGTACRQPYGSWKLQPAPAPAPPPPSTAAVPPPAVVYAPPPPPVVYAYPPAYFPPGYYYPQPYYTHVFIGARFGGGHHHHR